MTKKKDRKTFKKPWVAKRHAINRALKPVEAIERLVGKEVADLVRRKVREFYGARS